MFYLVNIDIDKYYFVGNFGLWVFVMGVIYLDIVVFEKYFWGVVFKNLEDVLKMF